MVSLNICGLVCASAELFTDKSIFIKTESVKSSYVHHCTIYDLMRFWFLKVLFPIFLSLWSLENSLIFLYWFNDGFILYFFFWIYIIEYKLPLFFIFCIKVPGKSVILLFAFISGILFSTSWWINFISFFANSF